MTFAETIKRTRQRLFFSQEAFAKELSVNLTTVSRWETGRSKPNISTMRQIKEFCVMSTMNRLKVVGLPLNKKNKME